MGAKKAPTPPPAPEPAPAPAPAPVAASNEGTAEETKSFRRSQESVNATLLTGGTLGNPQDDDPNTRRRSLLGSTSSSGLG